jgi:hypothetical protein
MKILTVEEALSVINKKEGYVRFNKQNFEMLTLALLNDNNFTSKVAKYRKGKLTVEEIMPTKKFRQWCKKLLESTGMDSKDADIVMSDNFKIDNVEGLYEFFTSAIYEYIKTGNRFDFPNKEDFNGGIYLKKVKGSKKKCKEYNPKNRELLGTYLIEKEDYNKLCTKSTCPKYLKKRKKI